MRLVGRLLLPVLLLAPVGAAGAERGIVIRAGEIKEQPFIDAADAQDVAANQAVTILARRGPWAQVEANGKTGWIRLLNLRLDGGASPGADNNDRRAAASLLTTGSSGKTVTTGVKGMDEEAIMNASVNTAELAELASYVATQEEAVADAKSAGLKENGALPYLKKGKK
jgi:hypothetical protein